MSEGDLPPDAQAVVAAAPARPQGRVLHIGKFFPPDRGGIESYLADLIAQQRAMGLEVAALVHGQPQPDDPPWLIRVPVQMQVVYAPIALGMWPALLRALKAFQPDVLHLHMPNLAVFWALFSHQAMAVPWVVHWHSDVMVNPNRVLLNLAYRFYEPLERRMLRGAQAIIATSPAYLRDSKTLWPWRGKTVAIPLGLQELPGSREALALPEVSGQPVPALAVGIESARPFRVLSIGRLAHYKGFDTLIAAVAQCPGMVLEIVGNGELHEALTQQIAQLPQTDASARIRLLGAVDEAEKLAALARCDLFALASTEKSEAFGLVVLEAMQFGKPCLVSQLPGSGLPWVVESSQAGCTAPVGDVPAWRDALLAMERAWRLRDQVGDAGGQSTWQQWSSQAHTAAHGYFAMSTNAQSVQRAYEQLWPEWCPPQHDVLVVVPARNQAQRIAAHVRALQAAGWRDVLVVDDQSTDHTAQAARDAGAVVLHAPMGLEPWGSIQLGLRWAREQRYTQVITMGPDDGDVQDIPRLMAQASHDLVIGACVQERSVLRRMVWAWFRLITGLRIQDLTSSFRLYGREAVAVLASREATMLDHQDMGTLLLLQRSKLAMVEVPVSKPSARREGKLKSWWGTGRYLLASTLLGFSRNNVTPWRPRVLGGRHGD